MTDPPEFYERAIGRIQILTLVCGLAGAVGVAIWKGPGSALAFLGGAILSLINLRSWRNVASALGGERATRPWRASATFLVFRYLLFSAAAFVIVKYLDVSLAAALLGLLASVAAVVVEIIYELIYART